MVTLTFEFNEKALAERGLTKDLFLEDIRNYSKEYGITENNYGVFEKEGEHALCLLSTKAINTLKDNPDSMNFISKLELNVNGNIEDCLAEYKRCLIKYGPL